MRKKHPGYYLILIITIQVLLVFSLNLLAKGETPSPEEPFSFSGRFELVDTDGNGISDHLGYYLPYRPDPTRSFWVCGELQVMMKTMANH